MSSLKGIGGYYEDDLHDFALLMLKLKLKLKYARAAYEETNLIPGPTVNGLAKKFAELIDVSYPDHGPVFAIIEKYDLPLGATLDLDDMIKRWEGAPKGTNTAADEPRVK